MLKKFIGLFVFLVAIFIYANLANADIVPDGLVAYWSLDADTIKGKDVEDGIGENDGVLNGKPKEVAGKINGALEFDGVSSVDIVGTDDLNFNLKEELTVAAWIKAAEDVPVGSPAAAGCCGTIVAQRDANGWALRFDGRNPGSEFEFIVCPNWQGDGGFGAPQTGVKVGEWHYITGVVNVKTMLLYLDGELIIEGPFGGPITSVGPETEIGKASDGAFIGTIDEVLIYNRALEEKEIIQNFQSKRFFAVKITDKLASCWGKIKGK